MPLFLPSSFSRLLVLILAVLFSSCILWADEEEEDTLEETEEEASGSLKIKSQTKLCSADYYIKGGNGDKNEDKKRINIGIGEEITFLLVGKQKGSIKELKWNIEGDGFKKTNLDQFTGNLKISLIAKNDLKKDTTAKIKAETSEGFQTAITINIKVPNKIEGKKYTGTFEGSDGQSINVSDYKIPAGRHGVIGFIEVTLSPTDVSFKNINVIEKDGGLQWKGKDNGKPKPALASNHTGNGAGKIARIQDKNTFYDCVSELEDTIVVLDTIRKTNENPQEFWWVCNAHVYLKDQKKDLFQLGTTNQEFYIEAFLKEIATKTIIKKFNVTFERNSNDG